MSREMARIDFRPVLGKKILITGDVNTGKTRAARTVLEGLCGLDFSPRIAVVDLAPEVPEEIAIGRGLKGVGGKLFPQGWPKVAYFGTLLRPPRLSSKSDREALAIAADNRRKIDRLFAEFQSSGRDILFVNDVSMYLQAGTAERLLGYWRSASTVVANGYYGGKLGTGALSARETTGMDKLIKAFPHNLRMPGKPLVQFLSEL